MKKIYFILILTFIFPFSGCKKEAPTTKAKENTSENFMPTGELFSYLPDSTIGIFNLNNSSKGSSEFIDSPWGDNSFTASKSLTDMEISKETPLLNVLLESLSKSGVDVADSKQTAAAFPNILLFVNKNKDDQNSGAVLLQLDPKVINSQKLFDEFQKLSESKKQTIEKVTISEIKALKSTFCKAKAKNNCKEQEDIYLANKENLIIATTDKSLISLLTKPKRTAPVPLLTSDFFKEATASYPDYSKVMTFGIFDNSTGLANSNDQISKTVSILDPKQDLIKGISFISYMDQTPRGNIRIVHKDRSEFRKIFSSSNSGDVLFTLPQDQLGFFSFDGRFIGNLIEKATKSDTDIDNPYQEQIDFLKSIRRFAVSLRMAPAGQSILPIPDLVIAVVSKNPEATLDKIKLELKTMLQANSAPKSETIDWSELTINENKAYQIQTPLGISAAVMSVEDIVVVSTSSAILESIAKNLKNKSSNFANSLKDEEKLELQNNESVFNIHLDFDEIAVFLKNMSGMLSMYAPANSDTSSLLSEKNIKALENMGSLTAILVSEPTVLELRGFYTASDQAKGQ